MAAKVCYLGSLQTLTQTLTDANGNLAAPTTISAVVTAPNGTATTALQGSMRNPSLGVYELDVLLNQLGLWKVVWATTGLVSVAADVLYCVDPVEA